MKLFYLFISGLFILTTSLNGQKTDFSNAKYWLDTGIGGYTVPAKTTGITFNLGANYIPGNALYKIRFLGNHEWFLNGDDRPFESFYSLGLLVGMGSSGEYTQFYLSAGLGLTKGLKRGKFLYTDAPGWPFWRNNHYEEDLFTTVSVPLEIDFVFKTITFASIGATLFADLNIERPNFGFLIKIGAGKLR